MLDDVLSIGGVIRRSMDTETGEVLTLVASDADAPTRTRTRPREDTLSTCHITPQIEWTVGGGLLKVKRSKREKKQKDGQESEKRKKRGKTGVFSAGARRRFMRFVNSVMRKFLPVFITLTYPDNFPVDAKIFKRDLDTFLKRLKRKFSEIGGVWKLELQRRGAPHFHLLVWGVSEQELRDYVPQAWYEVVGSGDWLHLRWHEGLLGHGNKHCVSQAESYKQVNVYVSKYIVKKVDADFLEWGRWWGAFGKKNIPFAVVASWNITEKKAIELIRYMRRFARLRSRDYRTLTIICNPDQWVMRLLC